MAAGENVFAKLISPESEDVLKIGRHMPVRLIGVAAYEAGEETTDCWLPQAEALVGPV